MTIAVNTPQTLLGVFEDARLDAPSKYFRDLAGYNTNAAHISEGEKIVFEEIKGTRQVAPFVLPTRTGVPTYVPKGSTAKDFKPAYIKLKDPVSPSQSFARQPGDMFTPVPRSPQANMDRTVGNILRHQKSTLDRRLEWMAAQATLYGKVKVEYRNDETVTVDFTRDAGQDITFVANYWSDPNHAILDDIQTWSDLMAAADFGGTPNRLTIGASVLPYFRKNNQIKAEMDLMRRGNTEINIKTGVITSAEPDTESRYIGTVGAGIDVYAYTGQYQNASGTLVPFMNAKDVLLTAPGLGGTMAYGAILDIGAQLLPQEVFVKMWDEQDPSVRFIMTQSAPLAIPLFPNRSLRARVLA